jgi:anti-anti-sigma factor
MAFFRAPAQSDNRGRRKRRGEFMPVGATYAESAGVRVPLLRDESKVVFATASARPTEEAADPAELRVQYTDNGDGKTTLMVSGTLDLSTVLPFRDAVFTAIGQKPIHLVVDVVRVSALDVAGISALVTASRVANLMKVPLSVSPSPSLKALLEETGIRLNVHGTEPLH